MKLKRIITRAFLLAALPAFTFCSKNNDDKIVIQDSPNWKTITAAEITVEVPENWVFKQLPGTDSLWVY